jgi:hypothetical protein
MIKSVLTTFILMTAISSFAQSLGDVNRSKSLTWCGIDFTHARFLNFGGELNVNDLKNFYLSEWTMSPLQDNDENFIRRKYGKKSLSTDTAAIRSRNSAIDFSSAITSGVHEIDVDDVKRVIAESNFSGSGYGVILIVESFDNANNTASVWTAYFNRSDGKLISTRRYMATSSSISGISNQWTETIRDIIRRSSQDLRGYK